MIRRPAEYRRELGAAPAAEPYRRRVEIDVDITVPELVQALNAGGLTLENPRTGAVRIVRRRGEP